MARGRKSSLRSVLSPEERHTLDRWQRSTTLAAGLVRWGKIILLLATGHSQSYVAEAEPLRPNQLDLPIRPPLFRFLFSQG